MDTFYGPLVSILTGFDVNNNNDDTKLLKYKIY